jgi:hypothetical protein
LNDTLQESKSSGGLIGFTYTSFPNRKIIGFVALKPFDEINISRDS